MGIEVFGKKEQESNENIMDYIFGFQIQGAIRSKSKEDAESILYNLLINRVEGLSQLIIRE